MTYGHLKPQKPTQNYIPRVFGFKIHQPWCDTRVASCNLYWDHLLSSGNFHFAWCFFQFSGCPTVQGEVGFPKKRIFTVDMAMKYGLLVEHKISLEFIHEINRAFVSIFLYHAFCCSCYPLVVSWPEYTSIFHSLKIDLFKAHFYINSVLKSMDNVKFWNPSLYSYPSNSEWC